MSSDFQPLSFKGYVGYVEQVWASVQVILVSDSKNLSPWPEETVIDPQETVCKCVLKMTFYFAMDDRNVKMLSSFTNAMCSSKISANTHCDTRLKISYVPQEKEPPWLGLSCLILLQGGLHSKVGPILPQFFPATIPKYDETATSSTALTRMCEHPPHLVLLSTDCTFVNKLLINTIRIFFNAFLTVVALTTNFQLAHKYFHLSLLHALCLLEPQTSLKNHAHLLLLHEVQLHHVLPYPQPSVLIGVIIKHTVPHSFILGRQ